MKYRLERFILDRAGGMLTRDGQQIDITWRALTCIACLVEHRHRVVGYDELIRNVWGHRDATNHQLSQVVLASRRALGDDGQSQRWIRTILGHGYRWVGPAIEIEDALDPPILPLAQAGEPGRGAASAGETASVPAAHSVATVETAVVRSDVVDPGTIAAAVFEAQTIEADAVRSAAIESAAVVQSAGIDSVGTAPRVGDGAKAMHAPAVEAAPLIIASGQGAGDRPEAVSIEAARPGPPPSERAPPGRLRRAKPLWPAAAIAALLACVPLSLIVTRSDGGTPAQAAPGPKTNAAVDDPLVSIEQHLWSADVEGARRALSRLPTAVATANDARLLAIRMEIEQGHFDRAEQRFQIELADPRAAADPVWRARLLSWQSYFRARAARDRDDVMRPAQEAVALIEAAKGPVPSRVLGEAMSARGTGHLFMGDLDAAVTDLVAARDILLKETDKRCATTTRHMLAHTWLRMGRLAEARDEFMEIAELSKRWKDPFAESLARNSATRIQIELLQWDAALANSRSSIDAAEKVPNPSQMGAALRSHALVLVNIGRPDDARAFLERARDGDAPRRASVVGTMLLLARGESEEALIEAAALFADFEASDNPNLILQNREGAMLLWMMAANDMRQAGKAAPSPSPAQRRILERPATIPGRIARGWWLYASGADDRAEAELRDALLASRSQGRLFYMTLAAEPLVRLLLDRHALAEAERVLAMVRGQNPNLMGRDVRIARLRLRLALAGRDRQKIEEAYAAVRSVAGLPSQWSVLPSGVEAASKPLSGRTKGFD